MLLVETPQGQNVDSSMQVFSAGPSPFVVGGELLISSMSCTSDVHEWSNQAMGISQLELGAEIRFMGIPVISMRWVLCSHVKGSHSSDAKSQIFCLDC